MIALGPRKEKYEVASKSEVIKRCHFSIEDLLSSEYIISIGKSTLFEINFSKIQKMFKNCCKGTELENALLGIK